jgi:predicted peptidase
MGTSVTAGTQKAHTFKERITLRARTGYLLYLPEEYRKGEGKWPLMLFLHGAGERGTDIELVKKHGPPKLVAASQKFPFIILSPQCPEDEYWSVPVLKALLDRVLRSHSVDRSRIYVTGLSMGGNAAWRMAIAHPNLFAAIAPICGWGNARKAASIKHIPAWAFHGGKDPIIALNRGESMVNSLKAAGGNVRFTVYPEADHDSWTATYENPEFYEWMLAQRKQR